MDSTTKKTLAIAVGLGAIIIGGLFLKNKIDQSRFKPLDREIVIQILKKTRKENFLLFKQVCTIATQIAAQMKLPQPDPEMIKAYLDTPDSPIKIQKSLQENYGRVCESFNTTYAQFNQSVNFYVNNKDGQIQNIVDECEKDFTTSLQGRLPEIKVVVPESLTKERLLEIQKKLTLKKYLLQVDMFRKLKGKTQQDIMSDPQLLKSLGNPEAEEEKILEEQGLGQNDQPAAAVFQAGCSRYRNDAAFKQQIGKIEGHYMKIFQKYRVKIQQNKITEAELNELEDELIYT